MRAEFDKNGVLNIIPENNAESMAIMHFNEHDGQLMYHALRFDHKGQPIMELKENN